MPNPVSSARTAPGAGVRAAEDHPEAPAAQRRRTEASTSNEAAGALDGLSARPGGPHLSLTPGRAQLRQWVRQPGLLIDNPDGFDRTGAQLLASPAAGAPRPTAVAGPGSLHLPAALSIPDAPIVRLPAERADVAVARRLVVDWLQEMRELSAEIHAEGVSPDDEAAAFLKLDVMAMPAIVAALNAERPGLNLVYAHKIAEGDTRAASRAGYGSIDWSALVNELRPGRLRVMLDNDAHGVALDLAVVHVPGQARPRASVLLLNPLLSPQTIGAGVVAELADELKLPLDWPLLVAEVPAQKDLRSCKIFALSMALKCNGGTFDQLHLARLRGEDVPLQMRDIDAALARPDEADSDDSNYSVGHDEVGSDTASEADSADSDADNVGRRPPRAAADQRPEAPPSGPIVIGQEVLHAASLVGPQFMKHAQSKTDVQAYIAARGPDALEPVNRQRQSLLARHEAHRVARWPGPTPPGHAETNDRTLRISSASIELKRISFLDKAIRHAATCDPAQVMAMAGAMKTVDTQWRDRYA